MRKLLLIFLFCGLPSFAQPVTPNFTTGTMSSTTNTTTSISESIVSTDYFGNSYEYSVTGTGISTDGGVAPNTTDVSATVNGQQYTYTGLDLSTGNKPVFTLTNPTSGAAFQFSESYRGPGGVSNITSITRQIESESVVTSTSVFSQ
jgi:phosphoribosylformylglycinamidine (FGAM) synthase-like enzyme